ncbi:hypothetical protein TWF730_005184 [Orbilia blumenaviensis]|uniref:MOSC domain-containing protein n=1 Tax=Orbilia blumenaviensis TaxID=1796055 RepID=A0AAV9VKE4_9PEZI
MKIRQLYVYPVKSLRGCSVPTATLTSYGLKYDRKYMVVRIKPDENGKTTYESQYVGNVDALCLFSASILPDYENAKVVRVTYNTPAALTEKETVVKHRGGEDPYIEFPISADHMKLEKVDLVIHKSKCVGYDMGAEYQEFFTKHLGYPAKLVYVGDSTRKVQGNLAPDQTNLTRENDFDTGNQRAIAPPSEWLVFGLFTWILWYILGWNAEGSKYTIQFSDVAPVLVASTVSLEELNRGKKESEKTLDLDITKLRPNIVLEPSDDTEMTPFEEDYWAELEVGRKGAGDVRKIMLTGNCGRCKSLNVDYETGKQLPVDGQMLKRLSDMHRRVDAGYAYSPIFGRYGFISKDSLRKDIKIGEEVTVTKKNKERTVFYWPGLSSGTRSKK